jgi:hypothetical protein
VSGYLGLDLLADNVRAANEFLSPLGDSRVIEVEKIKEVPVNVEVLNTNILDLVDYIWKSESSRGTNKNPIALHNYCRSVGKVNEWGYAPHLKHCFDTFKEGKAFVTLWVAEHLEQYHGNVGQVLCMYNRGEKITNCEYSEGYAK